jgi:uncharacterized protein (TIGR00106 family)
VQKPVVGSVRLPYDEQKGGGMVLLEFSMFPIGKGESVGTYVARSLDIVDRSGVPYRLNPMGTVLEGDWESVFSVVKKCFERMRRECPRAAVTFRFYSSSADMTAF